MEHKTVSGIPKFVCVSIDWVIKLNGMKRVENHLSFIHFETEGFVSVHNRYSRLPGIRPNQIRRNLEKEIKNEKVSL
jgi:hypothetical protein